MVTKVRLLSAVDRVVRLGPHTLYHGDAQAIMHTLEVDHIITDPPYSAHAHDNLRTNKGQRRTNKDGHRLEANFDSMTATEFRVFVSACMVAKGWTVMTCDHLLAPEAFHSPYFIRLGAWVKTNPMPQISADRPGQGHEAVLLCHSRGHRLTWNGGGRPAIWRGPVVESATYPTQKPDWLLQAFVRDFTARDQRQTVLDPMMGSGTTGRAVVKAGHRFIGIEAKEEGFRQSVERVKEAMRSKPLFK